MNYLDFIVLVPILWGMFKGFKNGLISEVGAVASLLLGIWLATNFSPQVGSLLAEKTSISEQYQEVAAFSLIFFVVVVLCFIVTRILKSLFKAISLAWLDKLLGILFGASKWIIIIAFIFFFIDTLIVRNYDKPIAVFENSLFYKPLVSTTHNVMENGIQLPNVEELSTKLPDFKNASE